MYCIEKWSLFFFSEANSKHVNALCVMNEKYLGVFTKLRKATTNFVMSVCPPVLMKQLGYKRTDFSWNVKFDYFFLKSIQNFNFYQNLTRITGTLHEDQYTFLITSR